MGLVATLLADLIDFWRWVRSKFASTEDDLPETPSGNRTGTVEWRAMRRTWVALRGGSGQPKTDPYAKKRARPKKRLLLASDWSSTVVDLEGYSAEEFPYTHPTGPQRLANAVIRAINDNDRKDEVARIRRQLRAEEREARRIERRREQAERDYQKAVALEQAEIEASKKGGENT